MSEARTVEMAGLAAVMRAATTGIAPRPRVSAEGDRVFRNIGNSRRAQDVIRRDGYPQQLGRVAAATRTKVRILGQRAETAGKELAILTAEQAREDARMAAAANAADLERSRTRPRAGWAGPTADSPTVETVIVEDRRKIAEERHRRMLYLRAEADECRRQADRLESVAAEIEAEAAQIRSARVEASDPPAWARPEADDNDAATRSGGLRESRIAESQELERALPRDSGGNVVRWADPRGGDWFGLVNAGGPLADPTRALNCVDAVLALFHIYLYGRVTVAAPRTFDAYGEGEADRLTGGEWDGVRRVQEATGGEFQNLCPYVGAADPAQSGAAVDAALLNLSNHLHNSGHGAFAFIITDLEGGGCHAWAAVNQAGRILFLDPQLGRVGQDFPLYGHRGSPSAGNVVSMDALVVTAEGIPAPLPFHGPGQWAVTAAPVKPRPATEFDVDEQLVETAHARMLATAERTLVDLRNIVRLMPGELRPAVVEEPNPVMNPQELAHAYAIGARLFDHISLDEFLTAERVRFAIEVPEQGYGHTVVAILRALGATGYRVVHLTTYWKPGLTLRCGIDAALVDGQGRALMVCFPTPRWRQADERARPLRRRLRESALSPQERVATVLDILRINLECGLPAHQPENLDALAMTAIATDLDTWIRRHPREWDLGHPPADELAELGVSPIKPESTVEGAYVAVRRGGTVTSIVAPELRPGEPLRAAIWSVAHDAWIDAPDAAAFMLYDIDSIDRTAPIDRTSAEQIARISLQTLLPPPGKLAEIRES